ncbi:hypothetical protein ANN_07440 [Periplaneta americana]|uniref:DDE-1 domain-containing protein n=1 Tax=Periplaneta americana TaxID=6978 RepID=A0ABQ8SYL8_PERAM|nr:hypothetical protein ANN_07440 [Periplaneta americana]
MALGGMPVTVTGITPRMPRNYQRKTERGKWSQELLETAIKQVREGASIRAVSKSTGIPFSSLQERIQKGVFSEPSLGRSPVFSRQQEEEIANHLKVLANMFYGLSPPDLCRAAYEFAERNGIKHNFNKDSCMAGRDWLNGFLQRNPTISVRKPEATSMSQVMDKYNFSPVNIYNIDETGIGTVQEPGNIMAPKGQKRVGSVTSWERGKNITIICAMNAAGTFVPPMFIFPRARMSPTLEKDGPPGAFYCCSKNGWTNEHLYLQWLEHFSKFVKCSNENPVLLLLDNHYSHKTLEAYEFCKKHGIVVVSIPPHTSHRVQPLDVTFFGPLKKAYSRECDLFMKSNFQKMIRPDNIAGLFNKAYSNVATIAKAVSGFRASGIYPLDPNIFCDEDFIGSSISQPDTNQPANTSEPLPNHSKSDRNDPTVSPQPGPSKCYLPFETVSPLPSRPNKNNVGICRERSKQHSQIFTKTPVKAVLEDKKRKREERNKKKVSSQNKVTVAHKTKQKKRYRRNLNKIFDSDSELDEEPVCDDNSDDDIPIESECEQCLICNEFGRDGELWYRCTTCGLWAHSECSGWDDPENYMCDICLKKVKRDNKLSGK